ncbi:MAG: tRNA (N6-isopentenyl adenosine(37)-C2)-methylthiotransferase MiaB [Planctomycetes bacterium]|nr:tRNA (N6-isopentenyl adenosine(37)-C2)-methylthiotransferase MiaB [Planctomycetota bacterium]
MGCQMNVLDSELVAGQLRQAGFAQVDTPDQADVVLINTCSVRGHAEMKALSRAGHFKRPKQQNPDLIVGVMGCMAQRDPEGILAKVPHVDLICGPGELHKIPAMIDEIRATRARLTALSTNQSRQGSLLERAGQVNSLDALDLSRDPAPGQRVLQSYIRVQRGCDKFCTFCVVPFTRGPERSRSPGQIVDEARMLVDRGAKEITLLGQTVNSYLHTDDGQAVRFSDLLERVQAVDGLERLRFVTSYPGDFTPDIFEAMRDLPALCEYLHLPVQSGSNAVLRRMRRQYDVARFNELLDRGQEIVPGITYASDFIVGFCGETEAEFAETVSLVERSAFKNIFVFKYSQRPDTVAQKRSVDDVPQADKKRRNNELLAVQERISLTHNQTLIDRTVEVLVEGYSKAAIKAQEAEQTRGGEVGWRRSDQLVGRTRGDQIVVFTGQPEQIGCLVSIRVTGATALTLFGNIIEAPATDESASLPVLA